jgi:hypothetical protein
MADPMIEVTNPSFPTVAGPGDLSGHPVYLAGDNYELTSSKPSIFTQAYDVATKGTVLTGISIARSFVNTAKMLGSWVTSTDYQESSAEDWIKQIDSSGDMYKFYKDHELGVEAAGLISGSFIPGMLAAKAVKLASGVKATGAFGKMMGYQDEVTEAATLFTQMKAPLSVFDEVKAAKYAGIAAGFGEQAVIAAAWETATIATMKANPTISQDGFMESVNHVFYGALTGGIIGGAFSGFVMNSAIKKGLINAESREMWKQKLTDIGMADAITGDKALVIIEGMDQSLAIAATRGAKTLREVEITADKGRQAASAELAKITPEWDRGVQDEFLNFLLKARTEGQMTAEELYEKLGGIAKIRRVGLADANPDELRAVLMEGPQRPGPKLVKRPTETEVKVEGSDVTIKEKGFAYEDITSPRFLNIKNGKEYDSIIASLGDLGKKIALSLDGTTVNVGEGSRIHSFKQQSLGEGFGVSLAAELPQQAQSRYVWAALKNNGKGIDFLSDIKRGEAVSVQDIPVMEQLYKQWDSIHPLKQVEIPIRNEHGELMSASDNWTNVGTFDRVDIGGYLLEQKQSLFARLVNEGKSADDIAMRINVAPEKLELLMNAGRGEIDDFIRPLSDITDTTHVSIQYSSKAIDQDGNLALGLMQTQQRIEAAIDSARTATLTFLQDVGAKVPESFFAGKTVMEANSLGSAPGVFSNRDPDPKSLAAMAENVGAAFKQLYNQLKDQTVERLVPHINALKTNPAAGAEQAIIDNMMRGTAEKFKLLYPGHADYDTYRMALSRQGLDTLESKGILVHSSAEIDASNAKLGPQIRFRIHSEENYLDLAQQASGVKGKYAVYPIKHEETVNFMVAHANENNARRMHHEKFLRATGMHDAADKVNMHLPKKNPETGTLITEGDLGTYYAPAMDTSKYKYISWVRQPIGQGGASSETVAIVATTPERMQEKIKAIKEAFPEYDVYTKEQVAREFKNRGDFDPAMSMQQSLINDKLARKGIFNDIQPDLNPENLADNYMRWHSQQTRRLVENFTELGNGQLFAELRHMGNQYVDVAKSKVSFLASKLGVRDAKNPFQEYIDTMLDRSTQFHAPLWQDMNEKAEALYNTAFQTAKRTFTDASKGIIPWSEATALTERMGLGNPYKTAESLIMASTRIPPSDMQTLVRTGNSIVAATQVRLDQFQSLINIVSTPVLLLAQASSAKFAAMRDLTSVAVPGSEHVVPSGSKVLYNGVKAFWSPEKTALMTEFKNRGLIPDVEAMRNYHAMIEDLATAPGSSAFRDKITGAVDKAAKLTGSDWAEGFTRFVTAHAGMELYKAQGLVGEELWAAVRTFSNRVQGNYIASQRPIVFQGVLGQAVGLFQTYQFNLMQQLFRFVGDGDKRTLAVLGAMQGSLYGMQGLPGFNILNSHIVGNAAGNTNHSDIFTGVNSYAGKDIADYLLYGGLSNVLNTGLYSRGDINPRQVSILPINPIDWPAISGIRRALDSVTETSKMIANGGAVKESLLWGLEHNGLSRPLAGMAQITQGYSTTNQNSLISAVDWNNVANASRVFGSRPLDEAIAMDYMYRKRMYDAATQDKIKDLGQAVRSTMTNGRMPDEDQTNNFMREADRAGIRQERVGAFFIDAAKKANVPAANELLRQVHSGTSRNAAMGMGFEGLPGTYDVMNPSVEVAGGGSTTSTTTTTREGTTTSGPRG